MASRCVSAISALHPLIAGLGFASGFRSDIADTHREAMLYNILHMIYHFVESTDEFASDSHFGFCSINNNVSAKRHIVRYDFI